MICAWKYSFSPTNHQFVELSAYVCEVYVLTLTVHVLDIHLRTVWVTKKFPCFVTRYRATVILRSVFIPVPFYNFLCFYCCFSVLKVWRKERLKNGKKNGAKTIRKIITVQRTFKKQCNNVKLQESKHECTDRTDGI